MLVKKNKVTQSINYQKHCELIKYKIIMNEYFITMINNKIVKKVKWFKKQKQLMDICDFQSSYNINQINKQKLGMKTSKNSTYSSYLNSHNCSICYQKDLVTNINSNINFSRIQNRNKLQKHSKQRNQKTKYFIQNRTLNQLSRMKKQNELNKIFSNKQIDSKNTRTVQRPQTRIDRVNYQNQDKQLFMTEYKQKCQKDAFKNDIKLLKKYKQTDRYEQFYNDLKRLKDQKQKVYEVQQSKNIPPKGLNHSKSDKNLELQKFFISLKESTSTNCSASSSKNISINDFKIGRQLGRGRFGKVKMVIHRATGTIFSIKIISKLLIKRHNSLKSLIRQIKIQSYINSNNITKLYSVFDDEQNVYMLLEYCHEGNLYDHLKKKKKIDEKSVKRIMKQLLQAVDQLHFNKIVHRDIKPENVVLNFGVAKVCDLGWSVDTLSGKRQTLCGSPLYMSPQVLKGVKYDERTDLWALGVLCYELIVGEVPFQVQKRSDLSKIIYSKIVYPSWISQQAISFMKLMLQRDPDNRLKAYFLLEHQFIGSLQ